MPQCIREPWAVYINTSSHSYSHVKSMCPTSWTIDLDCVQQEHWGQEGSKWDMEMKVGLGPHIQRRKSGDKAKGVQQWHNSNVLMQLEEVFWQCNKRGLMATREGSGETKNKKALKLARTLSAVPAWVWQMQQINPYLLPFGIKQNNTSKCWPGNWLW